MADEAFHGLAGDVVRAIEPHTEADPAALLVSFLVAFGNVIGRNAYFLADGAEHYGNLFAVLIGQTAKGRKGTSWHQIRARVRDVDESWSKDRIASGLSSGEGLIWAVRDPIYKIQAVKEKGRPTGENEQVLVDGGVEDKRLLVVESEFGSCLRVLQRDGNTLSATMRQAWDSGNLRTLTKNSPAVASGAHISIIGHITSDELQKYLSTTDCWNGFANRFLWTCVRRSKLLPDGGLIRTVDFTGIDARLEAAVGFAAQDQQLVRDDGATKLWHQVYADLSEGETGVVGTLISRSESQVMRLALLYALLDQSNVITAEHLCAAIAVWEYCEASVRHVFGKALGDPVASKILSALGVRPAGMTRTDISRQLGKHVPAERITTAISELVKRGSARLEREESGGRPVERVFCVE